MNKPPVKVLYLAQYPKGISPGQRFRFEMYEDVMTQANIEVEYAPFFAEMKQNIGVQSPGFMGKAVLVLKGLWHRIKLLLRIRQFDFVVVYREAIPLGPPLYEWLIARLLSKKMIFDFDDAIWMAFTVTESGIFTKLLKNKSKVRKICRWSAQITSGNDYLAAYAKQFNTNVTVVPTCVDTENHFNIKCNHDVKRITIGWTGSFSTLNYLEELEPVLKRLQEKYEFELLVICDRPPKLNLNNVNYVKWSKENEVGALSQCQIGLMPLRNEAWSEGKCGFKIIQYMALQIPAVSSPIGVNKKLVINNETGFLCNDEEEWFAAIERLLLDRDLRQRMGLTGRNLISNSYSLKANKDRFLSVFK